MSDHRSDFFARPPAKWNIVDYIDYECRIHPELPDRHILGTWSTTLSQISNCSRNPPCCRASHRSRADALLKRFSRKGRRADKTIALGLLKLRRPQQEPAVSINTYGDLNVNMNSVEGSVGSIVSGTNTIPTQSSQNDNVVTNAPPPVPPAVFTPTGSPSRDSSPDPELTVLNTFMDTFDSFDDKLKWRLPSGTVVEDILFKAYFKNSDSISLQDTIMNWVLDIANPQIQALFSAEDWNAIKAAVPPLPAADESLARFLVPFARVRDTDQLRRALRKASAAMLSAESDAVLDKKQQFDIEWTETLLWQLLHLYEHPDRPLCLQHSEGWYTTNAWSFILDKGLLSLPRVTLQRTEIYCQSTVYRRNRRRTNLDTNLKPGPRLDGLLSSLDDNTHEFCAIECAPELRGREQSTKWLHDKAKLARVLRDIQSRLLALVNHNTSIASKLQVVGISTAGLMMQVVRMCYGRGYISLLASEPIRELPRTVNEFQNIFPLVLSFIQIKSLLAQTITAFRAPPLSEDVKDNQDDEGAEEDDNAFWGILDSVSSRTAGGVNTPILPPPADSP